MTFPIGGYCPGVLQNGSTLLRVEHAWRCVQRAERDLEAAQERGASVVIEECLGAVYIQALANFASI